MGLIMATTHYKVFAWFVSLSSAFHEYVLPDS